MANRIQIRHGSGTPTTSNLLPYELGWNGDSLYINNGKTTPAVICIGGTGLQVDAGNIINTLGVTHGGTGVTSIANIQAGKDGDGYTISSTYLKVGSAYTSNPAMDGTASAGSSNNWARGDHVHPIDTSRLAASLKGAVNGVAELDSNSKLVAAQASSYIVTETGNFSMAASYSGQLIICNSTSDITITIPENSYTAIPVGFEVEIIRWNTGGVDVVASTGVTVNSAEGLTSIYAQYGVICLKKIDTNVWILAGALG